MPSNRKPDSFWLEVPTQIARSASIANSGGIASSVRPCPWPAVLAPLERIGGPARWLNGGDEFGECQTLQTVGRTGLPPELLQEALRKYGSVRLSVGGRSMWPLIPPGSTVRLRTMETGHLRPGTVVAVRRGERTVCHSVVCIDEERGDVVTRGLSRPAADPPCPTTHIVGVVTGVQWGPFVVRPGTVQWGFLERLASFVGWIVRLRRSWFL